MKFVLIAYNEAIDEEVLEVLSEAGVENYTKWTKVLGKGSSSGPHLDTHVWPKANNVLALGVEDAEAESILEGVRGLWEELGHEGIKAFQLPLDAMT
jgi:nitrogen regulatory protein PII